MAYPDDIDTFRDIENIPGLTYDPADKRTLFVEDLEAVRSSVVAIETILGLLPSGAFDTVVLRLDDVDTAIAGKQAALGYTPEDVANKDTNTSLGASDAKYPSQKAVKTYVDDKVAAIPQVVTGLLTISATGDITVTGLPFQPRIIEFQALAPQSISGTHNIMSSNGLYDDDAGTNHCQALIAGSTAWGGIARTNRCLETVSASGAIQAEGAVTSITSDGFVLHNYTYGTVATDVMYKAYP